MWELLDDRRAWSGLLRRVAAATRSKSPEDLLHSAVVKMEEYRSRARVENPGAFLVKTAINLAHDQRRQDARQPCVDFLDTDALQVSDESPLQDEVFSARERLRKVHDALSMLPDRTREAFLMRRIDNLRHREIAERLGITVSAVEKHVAKAALFLAKYSGES